MSPAEPAAELEVDGRPLLITHPSKVFFSARRETKLDLVNYYLAVGEGALRGVYQRPTVLKRYPNGAEGDFFYQKRVPDSHPDWLRTVTVQFPSGRSAAELCPQDVAHIVWAVNLGCMELHPWPVREHDLDHPDELRVDLDPQPGLSFGSVREVALMTRQLLDQLGLVGFPKTSGSRGIHVNVPIHPRWTFDQVRQAALALARELERRRPELVTSAWWKEQRGEKVFVDYNQNARDRTVASAYSVRPSPIAMVSCPLTWDEVPDVEPQDLTMATVPERLARLGDPAQDLGREPHGLEALMEMVERDRSSGLSDGAWPPHFPKGSDEPTRAAPSRRRNRS